MYLYFLSLVDDFTKEKLKNVALSDKEKQSAKLFIAAYEKRMIPQHEVENLRFKLIDSEQSSDESIEDFAFRLKQMSAKAFTADEEVSRSTSCYSAFLKGLASKNLRVKLRESREVSNFEQAVEEACRLHEILESEESDKPSNQSELSEVLEISGSSVSGTSYRRDEGHHDSVLSDQRVNRYSSHSRGRGSRSQGYRPHNTRLSGDRPQNHNSQEYRPLCVNENRPGSPSRSSYSNSAIPGSARRSRGPITCYNCGHQNHLARHCTLN